MYVYVLMHFSIHIPVYVQSHGLYGVVDSMISRAGSAGHQNTTTLCLGVMDRSGSQQSIVGGLVQDGGRSG